MKGAHVRRLTLAMPTALGNMRLRERLHLPEHINFLVARVGTERFAIEMSGIFEAVDASGLEPVPQLGEDALGVVTWRGAAHTVWSPLGVLRAAPTSGDTALFLRSDRAPVALAVDDIEDIVTVPGTHVRAMRGVDDGKGLILGALPVGDAFATVLDTRVLVATVLARVGETAA